MTDQAAVGVSGPEVGSRSQPSGWNPAALQSVAPAFGVERPIDARDADAIERGVMGFARGSDDGLIVTDSRFAIIHRDRIITLAARHRLPAVYPFRFYATGGGLMSYGPDLVDQYRQAAGYVDRILKGEKVGDPHGPAHTARPGGRGD